MEGRRDAARAGPLDPLRDRRSADGAARLLSPAWVLTFAHTLGEFGVVLMVGRQHPRAHEGHLHRDLRGGGGRSATRRAHLLSGILLALSFAMLALVYTANRRGRAA